MKKCLIDFENIAWESPSDGVCYKSYVKGNQRIRLVEFSEGFEEADWCTKGHAGYVLEGSFSLDFKGRFEKFRKGDILFIPEGSDYGHKAVLGKGEKVLLLLFEVV